MKRPWQNLGLISMIALAVLLGVANGVLAQTSDANFFGTTSPQDLIRAKVAHPAAVLTCKGTSVKSITDVAFEGFKFTPTIFTFPGGAGGGEGGCFDPTPVLTTTVTIPQGFTCVNAHFSAIVGSQQTYGPALNKLAVFQVTFTPLGAVARQHMIGHFETPYGRPCPAVGIEAETDVDTFGSNFFLRVGTQPGDIVPGNYKVDVWWAGSPPAPFGAGGAFAGAFVLKLYGG